MRQPQPERIASELATRISQAAREPIIAHLKDVVAENARLKAQVNWLLNQILERHDKSWHDC